MQTQSTPTASADPEPTPTETEPLLAFFIPDLSVGGAEQVTVTIVNGLVARGHNVELLLSRREGELRDELDDDVRVVTLWPDRTSVFGVGAHLPALIAYLRRRKPAVLVPHLRHPSVLSLLVGRAAPATKVVPTHHAAFGLATDRTLKDRLVERAVLELYPDADGIIAVSEGVAENLVSTTPIERSQITVLHNPVEVETVRRRSRETVEHRWLDDPQRPVVLFVGRHTEQKDLSTWLRTFGRVHDRRPESRAIVAGTGPETERVRRQAEQMGLGAVVSLPGYVDNPYGYMGRASVFLLSSRYEGLPTVLIEALACGCSVAATDCESGPREILEGGRLGALAPVGDDAALADGVERLLDEPTAPRAARERARDFAPEAVFDAYERFIDSVTR